MKAWSWTVKKLVLEKKFAVTPKAEGASEFELER